MKSNPAIFCLFFGLSLALIYRHPKNKNSVGAFDNRYSVKRFNTVIPYREPENGVGALEDIDDPDTSVFRNLENIYEMVLEAKNEVDDLLTIRTLLFLGIWRIFTK